MKKLTIAGIAIIATAMLMGGIYYFTLPKIEYNNTLFTSQRKKELSQITYWVADKEKNIHPGRKMDQVFALLAGEHLEKDSRKNSERDGHFSVSLQFDDSVMELGILEGELTVISDNKELDGLYKVSSHFSTELFKLLD